MATKKGLDKAKRLKEQREQAKAAAAPKPLNPPFPYSAVAFDPAFFKMHENVVYDEQKDG